MVLYNLPQRGWPNHCKKCHTFACEFILGVAGELDVLDIIILANKFVILLSCGAWYHIRGAHLVFT